MQNQVEFLSFPVFYLEGRRLLTNLKKISITTNGIFLNSTIQESLVIVEKENIKISNDKSIKKDNNDILCACINLGKYVSEHQDILEDFATCYLIYKNHDHLNFIKSARPYDSITKVPFYTLKQEYENLDIEKVNNIDFSKQTPKAPKYINDKTLTKLILKWLKVCGIPEKDVYNIEYIKSLTSSKQPCLIPIETLLHILDLSLTIFNKFNSYYNGQNKTFKPTDIKIKYHIELINEKFEIIVKTDNIFSLIMLMMVSYHRNEYKNLRRCEYCNEYFFGRKNKKCCSQNCKDLKNNKYEKRKERKKQNDTKYRKK